MPLSLTEVGWDPKVGDKPSYTFGTTRTPNPDRATHVVAEITLAATGGNAAQATVTIDGTTIAVPSVDTASGGLTGNPDVTDTEVLSFFVPAGSSYTITNDLDPAGGNSVSVTEQ